MRGTHEQSVYAATITAVVLFALIIGLMPGCATLPVNEVDRMIDYPGFQDAGKAAPGWTVEALETIDRLQRDLAAAQRY